MNQIPQAGVALGFAGPRESAGFASDFSQLTKVRLNLLVLITTFVGFSMASGDKLDWLRLLHTLMGTWLVAGGGAALNEAMEVDVDALMKRTRDRPLPARRMNWPAALGIGLAMSGFGLLYLALAATPLATGLAFATLLIYLGCYTPLKRRTALCTSIGAISGALPPVIGWTAVDGTFGLGAWVLFGILFAWQMPHFLAIAWMYRDEYAGAGLKMLRRSDACGIETAAQALAFSVGLTAITLVPVFAHRAAFAYGIGTLAFDLLLLACAIRFLLDRSRAAARGLFFASIFYLPGLLGLMMFTRK
ncbi:MAG: heme o synthase [Verrucomicrobiota bacterium]